MNLQYLRARCYDAKLGRFISEVPVEGIFTEPLSLNQELENLKNVIKMMKKKKNFLIN